MGQSMSCAATNDPDFFRAVQAGNLGRVESFLRRDSGLLRRTTVYDRLSALHIAAANGRTEVVDLILERSVSPDVLDRRKKTPLMVAAIHGNLSCVEKLLQAGANILMFDKTHERTCLHHAAYYGNRDCLEAILSAARSGPIAESWGFSRLVNVRDGDGATPLHLAARRRRPECVHALLDNGALVSSSTGNYGSPGSTPLHLAAHGGSLDCVRALLSWGADRLQRDSSGRIPYTIALKRKHGACAALLNPSSAAPLVWPMPLKFINELNPEAKALLESALMEANMAREKKIFKGTKFLPSSPTSYDDFGEFSSEESDAELCCICFEQSCTIEVRSCGHQMCARCTLALCCHNKPNPTTCLVPPPVCPFCRSNIDELVVAEVKSEEVVNSMSTTTRARNDQSLLSADESSSFKGLPSSLDAFGKIGRSSESMASENGDILYKSSHL